MTKELTPHIEYHPNGNVLVKGQKNSKGEKEGLWERFYENGSIQCRTPYKGGKEDGIEECFYPSGNIEYRTSFKDGTMDGNDVNWNEDGEIVQIVVWKDGKLIEETKTVRP